MNKSKFLRFFITIILLVLSSATLKAQGEDDRLQFYLVTCGVGTDVASSFGHSAIRMVDNSTGLDVVFNYGTYSFEEPNFIWKFLVGDLNYRLSSLNTDRFFNAYKYYNRGVTQREIILTPEQKLDLALFLEWNIQPDNKYYRYDFVFDNCATRIRDIFEKEDEFVYLNEKTDLTYRDNIATYIGNRAWLKYGTDILLASSMDKLMDGREEMFLPIKLESNLCEVWNLKTGKTLLGESKVINKGNSIGGTLLFYTPLFIFSLFLIICFVLFVVFKKAFRVISLSYYMILGVGGLVVCFMWFGTSHGCTPNNWNILWLNPLFLILPFFKRYSLPRKFIASIIGVCSLIVLIGGRSFLPQEINVAVMPQMILVLFSVLDECVKSLTLNQEI